MRLRETGGIVLAAALAAAALGVIGAGAPRAAAPSGAAAPTPAPQGAPSPTPSPGATPGATPAGPEAAPSPVAAAPPRIIRTVCTDHVCGGCDGKCRTTSGHVAVDKKGHCACTPTQGSDLDRAVRQAYERHPPQ